MLISLTSHGSGVGKDTVAEILARKYGFVQFSWASELRRYIAGRFIDTPHHYFESSYHIVPDKDWEESVNFGDALRAEPEEIRLMVFEKNKKIIQTMTSEHVVVSDTRYLREFGFLESLGFEMIKVLGHPRRGIKSQDNYLNQCIFNGFLNNFGSLEQLENQIDNLLNYVTLTTTI